MVSSSSLIFSTLSTFWERLSILSSAILSWFRYRLFSACSEFMEYTA